MSTSDNYPKASQNGDAPKLLPHELHLPLPPCPFGTPVACSAKKRLRREPKDPFFAAYLECTKSSRLEGKAAKDCDKGGGIGFGFGFGKAGLKFDLSCKHSCLVREEGAVKLSQLPALPARDRFLERRRRYGELYGYKSLHI